jgi:hypothetical protein
MQSVRPTVDTITLDTKEIPMSILKPILILPATLWGALALGGYQQPHSHEHLNGTWKGTSHSINSSGRSHTTKYLVLEVDEQGLIEGTSGWSLLEGPGGHSGDASSTQSEEKIIGTFVPATGEIHLVETKENGYLHGTMLDQQRIQMMLVQPGEKPVASSFILIKVEEEEKEED